MGDIIRLLFLDRKTLHIVRCEGRREGRSLTRSFSGYSSTWLTYLNVLS